MNNTQASLDVLGSDATITLSTANGVHLLSPETLQSLGAAIARVRKDPLIRTTTIRAEGKVFSAGADVKTMVRYGADEAREYGALGQGVFNDLEALPSITMAVINGTALGGGLELALSCDFRIAVKHAHLGLSEVTLGLIPGWGGIRRLTKLIGPSRAKKLYLSGVSVTAAESLPWGLVDEIVNSIEDLQSRAAAFRRHFHRASRVAIGLAKRASRDLDDVSAFADCYHTKDSREGLRAFLEKRTPSWMESA